MELKTNLNSYLTGQFKNKNLTTTHQKAFQNKNSFMIYKKSLEDSNLKQNYNKNKIAYKSLNSSSKQSVANRKKSHAFDKNSRCTSMIT